jgi:uncharacterized membrane protein YkvA (DUF1232 family)
MHWKLAVKRYGPGAVLRFLWRLPYFARLVARLLQDPRVGVWPKLLLVGTAGYVLSPVDVLPDWLPLVGALDDLTLVALACRGFMALCPVPIVAEHAAVLAGRPASEPMPRSPR